MEECASFLSPHLSVCIAKHETDGGKEVALSWAIASNDDIMLGRKWLDNSLILVAIKCELNPAATCKEMYLLNPWMIICLIYILADETRRWIYYHLRLLFRTPPQVLSHISLLMTAKFAPMNSNDNHVLDPNGRVYIQSREVEDVTILPRHFILNEYASTRAVHFATKCTQKYLEYIYVWMDGRYEN